MGRPPLGPLLRAEVEAFLAVSGTKLSILGEDAVNNPSFVGRLRKGASPRLATFDRVRAWMAANATEEEIRAIRERLADFEDPFAETRDAAGDPPVAEEYPSAGQGLDTREAAAWLGLSPKTLERYRVSGEGPDFQKFGSRVRYLLTDLEKWASTRRWTSTSEERTRPEEKGAVGKPFHAYARHEGGCEDNEPVQSFFDSVYPTNARNSRPLPRPVRMAIRLGKKGGSPRRRGGMDHYGKKGKNGRARGALVQT